MATKKASIIWQGHPAKDENHVRDLDLRAAIFQFHHGLDRTAAEERVKHEDRVERHRAAAAHHLDGLRAANAVGNTEDAAKHHSFYSLHLKALGLDPAGPVPSEVQRHRESDERSHAYKFKASPDDQFLVNPVQDNAPVQETLGKSETFTKRQLDPAEGYVISHFDEEHESGRPMTIVVAHDSNGEAVGSADLLHTGDSLTANNVEVEPKHRRKGIASAMYSYAEKLTGKRIRPHNIQSSLGRALWSAPGRAFGKSEISQHPSAPKYGSLRVVKHEDWQYILSTWTNLAKADGGERAQGTVKQFDARKTFLRNKHTPEEQAFDYSSWLTPEQNQNGYRMFALSHGPGNPVRVHVVHNQQKAGSATGNVDQGDVEVENFHVNHPSHENRGLEASMLNALVGHAKSHMGADYLSHGFFTPQASAFIEAVAKPHGLQLGDPEDVTEGETPADQPPGRLVSGGVKMYSKVPTRHPLSMPPRLPSSAPRGVPQWWRSSAEEGD